MQDRYSNEVIPEQDAINCSLQVYPPSTEHPSLLLDTQCLPTPGNVSSFMGSFTSTVAGYHDIIPVLHAASSQQPVQLHSFSVDLAAGQPDASLSNLVGMADENWTAGSVMGPFAVEAREGCGNDVSIDCGSYSVSLQASLMTFCCMLMMSK